MEKNNTNYLNWKKTALYTNQFGQENSNAQAIQPKGDFQDSVVQFFGIDPNQQSMPAKPQPKKPYQSTKLYKNQSKIGALNQGKEAQRPDFFQTTNNFYLSRVENAKDNKPDPAMTGTLPAFQDMNVSLRQGDPIWKQATYTDPEYRQEVVTTMHRKEHAEVPPEIAEKLRVTKFNRMITPISEYSNALHNGTIFKNPKFSSC